MTFRRQSLLVALAVVPSLLLAAGCGSSSATLSSIVLTPSPVRLAVGGTSQLTLTGSYSDGTRSPVSGATYTSSDAAVAAVNSAGTVTAIGGGTATVTAAASGLTATVTVVVSAGPVTLASIAILPEAVPLRTGATSQLTVLGTYSDGSELSVTSGSTFSSSSSGVATVSAGGLVTAVGNGTATITATHTASGLVATTAVTVSAAAPTLTSIAVVPPTLSLLLPATGQLTVTGTYSDSRVVDITAGCTFVSANLGVATVSASGLVSSVGNGTAVVTATHTASGFIGSTTVTVTDVPVTLTSITVAPTAPSIAVGASQQLTVTGNYSDSTTATLTTGLTYASNATGVATVSASGLVAGVAAGSATITVTHTATSLSATVAVTVTVTPPPTLTSITVAPTAPSIVAGATQQLTVTGLYSDSTTATLTTGLTYASSATGVATVSTSGLVTGVAAGAATITVTNTTPNLTATSAVTVTAAPVGGAVFLGSYPPGVNPLAGFGGSDTATNPVTIDATVTNNGNASLKIAGTGCSSYIGGYIASAAPVDLSTFNALTFWARTDVAGTQINNFGFGNDGGAGTDSFNVESHGPAAPFTGFALTTTFTKFYIPIPTPAALAAVNGLFYFSGPCIAAGANVWLNDIQFETLTPTQLASTFGSVVNASTGAPGTLAVAVGTPALIGNIGPSTINYTSASAYQVGWAYFTYASSNTAVATVDANGKVVGHTGGTANITVAFNGTTLNTIAVTVTAPLAVPTTLAATPTRLPADVIAMFNSSGTYTNVPVNTWNSDWSPQILSNYVIDTKTVMKYTNLDYVGIEFYNPGPAIDATGFTTLHIDVWTPNGAKFSVQLVNNVGGGQTVGQVNLDGTTTPAISTGSWVGLDIPLSSFTAAGLGGINALGQMLFLNQGVGSVPGAIFYIDNVYFWK